MAFKVPDDVSSLHSHTPFLLTGEEIHQQTFRPATLWWMMRNVADNRGVEESSFGAADDESRFGAAGDESGFGFLGKSFIHP